MRRVLDMAHARGIQMAMGFEFGVHPPELASIVPPESRIPGAMLPDPTHPANIEILQSAVEDLLTAYPGIDFVWLWLHEHSMFVAPPKLVGRFGEVYRQESAHFGEAAGDHDIFTGVWSLVQIRQVHQYLAPVAPDAASHRRLGRRSAVASGAARLGSCLAAGRDLQLPEPGHGRQGPCPGVGRSGAAPANLVDPLV